MTIKKPKKEIDRDHEKKRNLLPYIHAIKSVPKEIIDMLNELSVIYGSKKSAIFTAIKELHKKEIDNKENKNNP